MNGFLVIGRCGMDDVPIRMCATLEEAMALAENTTEETVKSAAFNVMCVDVSHLIAVDVVPFRDGVPQVVLMVKLLGGEEEQTEMPF